MKGLLHTTSYAVLDVKLYMNYFAGLLLDVSRRIIPSVSISIS